MYKDHLLGLGRASAVVLPQKATSIHNTKDKGPATARNCANTARFPLAARKKNVIESPPSSLKPRSLTSIQETTRRQ
ncbi:hypothetical protein TgHK011_002740 [Trichoderma gracile]|nr:hypothetical protein TgHK011_002740 [Trichoderma gracile]